MPVKKPRRTNKKSNVIDRLKRDPQTTIQNEAKKAGIPKPATKAIMGLTLVGLVSTGLLRNKIRALPFGDWLDIPMGWGAKIRRTIKK